MPDDQLQCTCRGRNKLAEQCWKQGDSEAGTGSRGSPLCRAAVRLVPHTKRTLEVLEAEIPHALQARVLDWRLCCGNGFISAWCDSREQCSWANRSPRGHRVGAWPRWEAACDVAPAVLETQLPLTMPALAGEIRHALPFLNAAKEVALTGHRLVHVAARMPGPGRRAGRGGSNNKQAML